MSRLFNSFMILCITCITAIIFFTAEVAQYAIFPMIGIESKGLSGSLWQQKFQADVIQLPQAKIHRLVVTDFKPFRLTDAQVSIEELSLTEIDTQASSGLPIVMPYSIRIDKVNITLQNIQPLEINDIYYMNTGEFTFSLNTLSRNILVQTSPSGENQFKINTTVGPLFMVLSAQLEDDEWIISHENNTVATYQPVEKRFSMDFKNQQDNYNIDIYGQGHLNQLDWYIHLKKFESIPNELSASAHINLTENFYNINIISPQVNAMLLTSPQKDILLKGEVSDLHLFTPLASGNVRVLGVLSHDQQLYISAQSPKITLPAATVENIDLTYIPASSTPIKLYADRIYNPGASFENLTITSAQSLDGVRINLLTQSHGFTHSAEALMQIESEEIELILQQLRIRNSMSIWQSINPIKINISPTQILLDNFNIHSQDSHLNMNGRYHFIDKSWQAQLFSNHLPISINTNGLINIESNIDIGHADLKFDLALSGISSNLNSTTGTLSADNISAQVLNIAPDFLFPLNYNIDQGYLSTTIKNNQFDITGHLQSTQGDINIDTVEQQLKLSSSELQFNFGRNTIRSKFKLLSTYQHVQIHAEPYQLYFFPDEIVYYQSLPSDIIINDHYIEAQAPYQTAVDIYIETETCETNFLGFNGSASAKIHSMYTPGSSEKVTGSIQLNDPKINVLNRQINLEQAELQYQSQPWLLGNIKLELKQNVTLMNEKKQASTNQIYLNVGGKLSNPTVEINSKPKAHSAFEILMHLMRNSPTLPVGNENITLIEYISGLSRSNHALGVLNLINNLGTALNIDISFQNRQESSENSFNDSELVLTKQISDKLWISLRHQINDFNPNSIALSLKLKPNISLEGQYNQNSIGASILYQN
ncbi:translocation/assembly module TamB [Gammaproteobacteria bacterium]|nr:translocation/assembly module TamB [Gammaproteobacteria bacterium]